VLARRWFGGWRVYVHMAVAAVWGAWFFVILHVFATFEYHAGEGLWLVFYKVIQIIQILVAIFRINNNFYIIFYIVGTARAATSFLK
jgi:hypothetical protein